METKRTEAESCGSKCSKKYEPDRRLIRHEIMGKLLAINISKERGTEKREVPQAELVADYGIMGDAHAGKWRQAGQPASAEKIDAFRARGAQIDNGAFGENLVISGFDFKNLPLGTRFCIGDAILEMTQIGKQCHSHCAIYKRMGECIMPKRACLQ